jgi:hypothetical protein
MTTRLARIAEQLFGIDLRSLALFRICLALVVLADLAIRAADLTAHYTDAGVLPRAALLAVSPGARYAPLYLLDGSALWPAALFLITAACAVALLIGYRTRWALGALWVLVASLQARNPFVLNGGDNVLRLMLFWSLFVPLGAAWSLDRRRGAAKAPLPQRVASVGTAALLAQAALLYVFAGLLKSDDAAWRSGTAIFDALHLDAMVTPVGRLLGTLPPALLAGATHAVRWGELLGPLAWFVPVATARIRAAAVTAFAAMQLLFGLSLELGLFPWVSVVATLPLLPTACWEFLAARAGGLRQAGATVSRTFRRSWAAETLAAFLLGYVFLWNLGTLEGSSVGVPRRARWIGQTLQVSQNWGMFTGLATRRDFWFLLPGRRRDGAAVELTMDGAALTDESPRLISASTKNARWAAYGKNLWQKRTAALSEAYAQYLCRHWNARLGGFERLEQVEVLVVTEPASRLEAPSSPEQVSLGARTCQPDGSNT